MNINESPNNQFYNYTIVDVIFPKTEAKEAIQVTERLGKAVANTEVTMPVGLPIHFTVSIGVTTLHDKNVNLDM